MLRDALRTCGTMATPRPPRPWPLRGTRPSRSISRSTGLLATLFVLAAGSAYCCLRRVLQAARIGHAVEGDTQATGEDCARCELTSERPSSVLRAGAKEAGEAPASAWYLIAFSDHVVPAEQMPGLTATISKQLRQASLQVKVLSPDAGADLETVRCL